MKCDVLKAAILNVIKMKHILQIRQLSSFIVDRSRILYILFYSTDKTSYGDLRPQIAFLWLQKCCGLQPPQTVVAEVHKCPRYDFKLAHKMRKLAILYCGWLLLYLFIVSKYSGNQYIARIKDSAAATHVLNQYSTDYLSNSETLLRLLVRTWDSIISADGKVARSGNLNVTEDCQLWPICQSHQYVHMLRADYIRCR